MLKLFRFLTSTIGSKYIMALTGLGLVGFVVVHLLGNLQIFIGPDALNAYGQTLKNLGPLLWVARLGLIGMFALHIATAVKLSRANENARPVNYQVKRPIKSTLASRTMILSGLVILAYTIYHLLHFTFQALDPSFPTFIDAQGRHDIYKMIVVGFSSPAVTVSYVVAQIFLGLHLSHGISSVLQTFGFAHKKYRMLINLIGPAVAILIAVGYMSIPLSVIFGCIK